MCKIVGREGTASLVVIPALVQKISQENQRGARNSPPPPSGARVNSQHSFVFENTTEMGTREVLAGGLTG